ncbi:sensor histidine kinase [Staphylococcus phage vB_SauH_DELF3]|nr:sensor histidine kinase [Staphylococcus phage vB_SauH_DELF3]
MLCFTINVTRGTESELEPNDIMTGKPTRTCVLMRITPGKYQLSRPGQKGEVDLPPEYEVGSDENTIQLNGIDPYHIIVTEASSRGLIMKALKRNFVTLKRPNDEKYVDCWVPTLMDNHELYLVLFKKVYHKNFPYKYAPFCNTKVSCTQLHYLKALQDDEAELSSTNIEDKEDVNG